MPEDKKDSVKWLLATISRRQSGLTNKQLIQFTK
jgi:hypothetical protein